MTIKVILFAAFGTLCQVTSPRRPFERLARQVPDPVQFTRGVMTESLSLSQAARRAMAPLSREELAVLEQDLQAELASIELFPEVPAVCHQLRASGLRLAVLSNLAAPYAPAVEARLPTGFEWCGWSSALGYAKPDPRLYELACRALTVTPDEVLMVGNNRIADINGARACGMQAAWLRRQAKLSVSEPWLAHLGELPCQLSGC